MRNFTKLLLFLFILLFLYFIPVSDVYAHPGRTDEYGCHTCRTNCEKYGLEYGEYHCHNGSSSKSNKSVTSYYPMDNKSNAVKNKTANERSWAVLLGFFIIFLVTAKKK